MTKAAVKKWIETKMSEDYIYKPQPGTVEVFSDPEVAGTYAARFKDDEYDGEHTHLLFVTGTESGSDDEILSRCLEEVEFTTWPPTSGPLQFP